MVTLASTSSATCCSERPTATLQKSTTLASSDYFNPEAVGIQPSVTVNLNPTAVIAPSVPEQDVRDDPDHQSPDALNYGNAIRQSRGVNRTTDHITENERSSRSNNDTINNTNNHSNNSRNDTVPSRASTLTSSTLSPGNHNAVPVVPSTEGARAEAASVRGEAIATEIPVVEREDPIAESHQDQARVQQSASEKAQESQEIEQIQSLKARDREVRNHEQAHASAGGAYTGSPSFDYAVGPDGVRYAVAGDVSVDTSPVPGDPEATLEKATTIRRAALAPAEPSSQDRRVAAEASQLAAQARVELLQLRAEDNSEDTTGESVAIHGVGNMGSSKESLAADEADKKEKEPEDEKEDDDETPALFGAIDEEDASEVLAQAQQKASALDRFQQIYGYVSELTNQVTENSVTASNSQQIQSLLNEFA